MEADRLCNSVVALSYRQECVVDVPTWESLMKDLMNKFMTEHDHVYLSEESSYRHE